MDEKAMCTAIQAEIDKPSVRGAAFGITSVPLWVTLTFKFIVKKVSDIAVETCLSGLELAGLTRTKVRADVNKWLDGHPEA